MSDPSNLTMRQRRLLRSVADVYETGCESEFFFVQTMGSGPKLIYSGRPAVDVEADETDFHRLATEGLVDLGVSRGGDLKGKPTAKGVAFAKHLASRSPGEPHSGPTSSPPPIPPSLNVRRPKSSATHALDESRQPPTPPPSLIQGRANTPTAEQSGRIFIGHGKSKDWMELREFIEKRLKLNYEEFNRESVAGMSIKDRLSQMLSCSSFALLVLTGEDEHADGTRHARENVIHEVGLFQGRLGFNKAIVLLEYGCEHFSNIDGIVYISFPKGCIRAAFYDVEGVLEREGLITGSRHV